MSKTSRSSGWDRNLHNFNNRFGHQNKGKQYQIPDTSSDEDYSSESDGIHVVESISSSDDDIPNVTSDKSTNQTNNQTTNEPSKQSAKQPSKQSPKQSPKRSAKQPSNKSTAEPSKQSVKQPVKQSSKQSSKQPSKQPSKQSVKQPSKQSSKQPSKKVQNDRSLTQDTEQSAKQASKQPSNQSAKQASNQSDKKSAKQPSNQPSNKSSKQPSKQSSGSKNKDSITKRGKETDSKHKYHKSQTRFSNQPRKNRGFVPKKPISTEKPREGSDKSREGPDKPRDVSNKTRETSNTHRENLSKPSNVKEGDKGEDETCQPVSLFFIDKKDGLTEKSTGKCIDDNELRSSLRKKLYHQGYRPVPKVQSRFQSRKYHKKRNPSTENSTFPMTPNDRDSNNEVTSNNSSGADDSDYSGKDIVRKNTRTNKTMWRPKAPSRFDGKKREITKSNRDVKDDSKNVEKSEAPVFGEMTVEHALEILTRNGVVMKTKDKDEIISRAEQILSDQTEIEPSQNNNLSIDQPDSSESEDSDSDETEDTSIKDSSKSEDTSKTNKSPKSNEPSKFPTPAFDEVDVAAENKKDETTSTAKSSDTTTQIESAETKPSDTTTQIESPEIKSPDNVSRTASSKSGESNNGNESDASETSSTLKVIKGHIDQEDVTPLKPFIPTHSQHNSEKIHPIVNLPKHSEKKTSILTPQPIAGLDPKNEIARDATASLTAIQPLTNVSNNPSNNPITNPITNPSNNVVPQPVMIVPNPSPDGNKTDVQLSLNPTSTFDAVITPVTISAPVTTNNDAKSDIEKKESSPLGPVKIIMSGSESNVVSIP